MWWYLAAAFLVLMLLSVVRDIYWCHRNPEQLELEDALEEMRLGIDELEYVLAEQLLPAIQSATEGMTKMLDRLSAYDREEG